VDPPELSHDDRLLVRDAAGLADGLDWSADPWRDLTSAVKSATGKKGRDLFHPLRVALTGRESGPEMAGLVRRIGKERAIRRLEAAAKR
jgi:glutamyl-tRNA synthetase